MAEINNNLKSKITISNDTKEYIVTKLIEPSYRSDIKNMINGKKCWRVSGITFETITKILVACGGVLSFSSGYYQIPLLSLISGCLSTFSLAVLQFSSFSYKQYKKQGDELNMLLKKLDIDTIPVLQMSIDTNTTNKQK